jgi:phosphatidate cytidylyltransferase
MRRLNRRQFLSALKVISGIACAVAIFAVLGIDYFVLHSHLAYFLFFLFFLIVSSIELCRIAGVKSRWAIILAAICTGDVASYNYLSSSLYSPGLLERIHYYHPPLLLFIAILLMLPVISSRIRSRITLQDLAVPLFAVVYVGGLGACLFYIPSTSKILSDFSHATVLWFICTTKANDILGYLLGSSIGKRQLNSVSPKKTVEGSVAGLVGGILISLLVVSLFLSDHFSWYHAILFGIIVGVAAQAGDLAESLIKRLCGVKDSGNLIPGSGGALDFIDCFLFAAPVAYYFLLFGG